MNLVIKGQINIIIMIIVIIMIIIIITTGLSSGY